MFADNAHHSSMQASGHHGDTVGRGHIQGEAHRQELSQGEEGGPTHSMCVCVCG